jgi:hypothetical protein
VRHWLLIGFSDDCRLFVLGFVAVFVLAVIVIPIPRSDHVGHGRPRGNPLGDAGVMSVPIGGRLRVSLAAAAENSHNGHMSKARVEFK